MNRYLIRKLICLVCLLPAIIAVFPADLARSSGLVLAAVLSSDQARYRNAHKGMVRTLASKGYDQSSIEIISQVPNPDPISWSNAIRKASAIGARVIVTYGAPATLAATQEAPDIPVVFVDVYDPLAAGIVKSLASPGGNATGVSSKVPLATLVKTATAIKPLKQVGVLYSKREIGSLVQLKEIKRLAVRFGFSVVEADISNESSLNSAMSALGSQVDFFYLTESSVVGWQLDKVIHLASEKRIPVMTQIPDAGEKGALVSLEAHPFSQGQQAADIIVRVLSGKKPSVIPVVLPKKIDLVVNMKTARAFDIHVPLEALNIATKVIK